MALAGLLGGRSRFFSAAAAVRKPEYGRSEAAALFAKHWGTTLGPAVRVEPLPSYDDMNWAVTIGGATVVLKIAAERAACRGGADAAATRVALDAEAGVMAALAGGEAATPRVLPAACGASLVDDRRHGVACFARVVSFVDGAPLSAARDAGAALDHAYGAAVGAAATRLAAFDDRGAGDRDLAWDLTNADRSRAHLGLLPPPERALVAEALDAFKALNADPDFQALPAHIIHGDLNDENVLARRDGAGAWRLAFIDFGDFVRTKRIYDVAIALAYRLFDGKHPAAPTAADGDAVVKRAAAFLGAYHAETALLPAEIGAVLTCVAARNAQSVLTAAREAVSDPDDPYAALSVQPAYRLLATLAGLDRRAADAALRAACGFPAP